MAQRVVVELSDDLDGKPIPDGKGETVRFALDRQEYEIDLGEKNAKALRDAFSTYVTAARRVSGASRNASRGSGSGSGSGSGRSGAGRSADAPVRDYDPKAVRAWAEQQGLEVSQRGRVPTELVTKFQEANA